MAGRKIGEGEHLVPEPELREHATLAALRNVSARMPGFDGWSSASLGRRATTIHDVDGRPLFRDFRVARGDETVGHVRTAASRVLGPPVVSLELGRRSWNFEAAAAKLAPRVRREHGEVSPPLLVCYSYPKMGVMFEVEGKGGGRRRLLFDVASLQQVREGRGRDGAEGGGVWSFYDGIDAPERGRRLKRFARDERARDGLAPAIRRELVPVRPLGSIIDRIKIDLAKFRLVQVKQLQFCDDYASSAARSHHCFVLHGQQVDDYCAVATCEMILCYYRYYYTQDQIAPALGYSAGGCPPDQSAGYEQLTGNHLDATFDASPTWEKARDEINALRPFKSGIAGHARACAGYSRTRWFFGSDVKQLYVYDPWPWNADLALGGTVSWEDWDSITHTNYVLASLQY